MKDYLKLIRWKNLAFVALIQVLMQYAVVLPTLQSFGFTNEDLFQTYLFIILVIATVAITAGGYVINDYFDLKIDRINKPDDVIIDELIDKKQAMRFYQVLTVGGTILGLILAFLLKSYSLALIFILTPGLLWFYSASYKRQFLIGNLIVSILAALSIFIVALYASAQLTTIYSKEILTQTPIIKQILFWVGSFSIFAFFLTWVRELIKDMEDVAGDREMECRTLPIVWGIKRAKVLTSALIVIVVIGLVIAFSFFYQRADKVSSNYTLFALILPLVFLVYEVLRAKAKDDFHTASLLAKIIMFVGVLYSMIFYFLIAKAHGLTFLGLFIIK